MCRNCLPFPSLLLGLWWDWGRRRPASPFLQQELPLVSSRRKNTIRQTDSVNMATSQWAEEAEAQSHPTLNEPLSAGSLKVNVWCSDGLKKRMYVSWQRSSAVQNGLGLSFRAPCSSLFIDTKETWRSALQKFLPLSRLGQLTATNVEIECEARPGCKHSGLALSGPSTNGSNQLVWLSLTPFCIF